MMSGVRSSGPFGAYADALGSIDTITQSDGSALTQTFDPFGMPVDPPNPSLTRAGFSGRQHDNDLGVIDMKGRIYDPLAGRFMSADPLTQAPFWSQGLNRYAYVFNDPANLVDPTGFIGEDSYRGVLSYLRLGYGEGLGISVASGLGGALFNVGVSLYTGGYGGGSAGSVRTVIPSSVPAAVGQGKGSMNATAQNQGGVGPSVKARKLTWKGPDLRLAENDAGSPESIPDAAVPGAAPMPAAEPSTGPGTPYVGDPVRKPPGWTPDWREGLDPRGPYAEDPLTGEKWYPHHEDVGHWDHYENDQGLNFPRRNTKPWAGQKRPPYGRQSPTDPWLLPTAGGGMMLLIFLMLLPVGI